MYLLQHSHFLNAVCLITELFFVPASAPYNGIIESLFVCVCGGGGGGGKKEGQTFVWGGLEDGIVMTFSPHHIYCAQSNVKWRAHGVNGGHAPPNPLIVRYVNAQRHIYKRKLIRNKHGLKKKKERYLIRQYCLCVYTRFQGVKKINKTIHYTNFR